MFDRVHDLATALEKRRQAADECRDALRAIFDLLGPAGVRLALVRGCTPPQEAADMVDEAGSALQSWYDANRAFEDVLRATAQRPCGSP